MTPGGTARGPHTSASWREVVKPAAGPLTLSRRSAPPFSCLRVTPEKADNPTRTLLFLRFSFSAGGAPCASPSWRKQRLTSGGIYVALRFVKFMGRFPETAVFGKKRKRRSIVLQHTRLVRHVVFRSPPCQGRFVRFTLCLEGVVSLPWCNLFTLTVLPHVYHD